MTSRTGAVRSSGAANTRQHGRSKRKIVLAVLSASVAIAFSEELGRYVVYVDTAALPIGTYLLKIPLTHGRTVEMTIGVDVEQAP